MPLGKSAMIFLRFGGMLQLLFFILQYFLRAYIHYLFMLHVDVSWLALDIVGLLWGAEKRLELGPALQQAEALLLEPRRTQI
jgi:hypothetical protein